MFKTIAFSLGLLASSFAFAEDGPEGSSPPLTPMAVYDAVGAITKSSSSTDGFCTAFHIGEGMFLTAGHCIDSPRTVYIRTDYGKTTRSFTVDYSFVSPPAGGLDIGILHVKEDSAQIKTIELDCDTSINDLDIKTPVEVIGFPASFGRTYTDGYIASKPGVVFKSEWKNPTMNLIATIAGGSSGSPVIVDGKAVSILVGALPEERSLSVATPLDGVCEVLNHGT